MSQKVVCVGCEGGGVGAMNIVNIMFFIFMWQIVRLYLPYPEACYKGDEGVKWVCACAWRGEGLFKAIELLNHDS